MEKCHVKRKSDDHSMHEKIRLSCVKNRSNTSVRSSNLFNSIVVC